MAPKNATYKAIRSVVVVDPAFDGYKNLAAEARAGRIDLHFRSSGTAALKLAGKIDVDAWIVAAELEDMAGNDFVDLLRLQSGSAGQGCICAPGNGLGSSDDVHCLNVPVTCDELESLFDDVVLPTPAGKSVLAKFFALPLAGIGLATSIIIALQSS